MMKTDGVDDEVYSMDKYDDNDEIVDDDDNDDDKNDDTSPQT